MFDIKFLENALEFDCGVAWRNEQRRDVLGNVSNTRYSVSSGYPNTKKRVENTTRSGIFLTKFKVFG